MRKLIAAIMVAGAAVIAGPALGADFPEYPPIIEIPDVDYGVEGSFYLRGSAAANLFWTREAFGYDCGCATINSTPFSTVGYGYSLGAGFGFETGTGLRVDATVDYISNTGASLTKTAPGVAGDYSVNLRSTLALANAYYDFSFGGDYGYGAAGGAFGYVGVGAGVAFNDITVDAPVTNPIEPGSNTSLAAAGMVGVGYDFGAVVADLGYRAVYINHITNDAAAPETVWADHNWLHEVRGTVRYRFN